MIKALENCWMVKELLGMSNGNKATATPQIGLFRPEGFTGDACIWIKSDPKYVSAVRAMLMSVCAGTKLSDQDKDDLKLAVGEAVCNAVQHGSPNGNDDCVCVSCSVGRRGVIVTVSDSGGKCLRRRKKQRMETLHERGYGLLLMKQLTSALRIRTNGCGATITLEKRFSLTA
ncbi:MAG: ATP-binding protein [Armatimonadota bacterium]|nr:ATP-binding protein [Armatimonadota bacterium]